MKAKNVHFMVKSRFTRNLDNCNNEKPKGLTLTHLCILYFDILLFHEWFDDPKTIYLVSYFPYAFPIFPIEQLLKENNDGIDGG